MKLVFDLSTTLLTRTKAPRPSKSTPQAANDDSEQIDTSSFKKPTTNGSSTASAKLAKEESKSSGTPLQLVAPLQLDDGGKLEDLKVALGDKVRDAIRKGLVQAMVTVDLEKGGRGEYLATRIALAIEEEVSAATKGEQRAYTDKIRSILSNLKDPKNPELRKRLLDGLLTPK
jgi:transcription elongation factor S-II